MSIGNHTQIIVITVMCLFTSFSCHFLSSQKVTKEDWRFERTPAVAFVWTANRLNLVFVFSLRTRCGWACLMHDVNPGSKVCLNYCVPLNSNQVPALFKAPWVGPAKTGSWRSCECCKAWNFSKEACQLCLKFLPCSRARWQLFWLDFSCFVLCIKTKNEVGLGAKPRIQL